MRLGFCLLPAALAAGFCPLALPAIAFAQQPASGLAAVHELPATPQPQFALAEAEPPVQQASAGQSQAAPAPSATETSAARNNANSLIASLDPSEETSANNESSEAPAPGPETGNISGTVLDVNGDLVPGVTVVLEGTAAGQRRTVVADKNGFFQFHNLKPGSPYKVTINVRGFASFSSPAISLDPGQFLVLTTIKLQIAAEVTSVKVYSSTEQIATEQVRVEEQQRIFGIIPNFYVTYDQNPVPLTAKLKYKLALRVSVDPVTIAGVAFAAGIYQAADTPDFVEGAQGYGQRFGALYTDGLSDIMIGGAVLPSLLHQDPRYFYQGTGTNKSRTFHALSSPFVCRGDNGHLQPNYSSIGGDLATASLANAYYPASNRGAGMVFGNFLISTGERVVSSLAQEFILGRLTSKSKNK